MRAYGLIEGRGEVRITEIGEKIARRRDQSEYKEALVNAIRNIPLWDVIYEMFTKQGKEPTDSIILLLETYCGLSPSKAIEKAPEVKKQYNEDVKAIRSAKVITVNESIMTTEQTQQDTQSLVEYGFGKYKVYLPEDDEEAKMVWSKLKKMVDSVIGEEKTE